MAVGDGYTESISRSISPILFDTLCLDGTLWTYLADLNEQAQKIKASGLTLEEYLAQPNPTGIPGEAASSTAEASSGTQG